MTFPSRLLVPLAFLAACHGELVPIEDDDVAAPGVDAAATSSTWSGDVAHRMARCTSCHGSAGRYSLESYVESFGPGTDAVPNVVARDARSALVEYCRRGHGGATADDVAALERWIADGAREE